MLKVIVLSLVIVSATFSEQFTSGKTKPMVLELKLNKYENAIKLVVSGSILEEKIIQNEKTKKDLISEIQTIQKNYGDFVDFEKVYETTLGKVTKIYYFLYCKEHPINVEVVLYTINGKEKLIDFNFDDKVVDLIEHIDSIKRTTN